MKIIDLKGSLVIGSWILISIYYDKDFDFISLEIV